MHRKKHNKQTNINITSNMCIHYISAQHTCTVNLRRYLCVKGEEGRILTAGCMRYDWWCIQDGLCTCRSWNTSWISIRLNPGETWYGLQTGIFNCLSYRMGTVQLNTTKPTEDSFLTFRQIETDVAKDDPPGRTTQENACMVRVTSGRSFGSGLGCKVRSRSCRADKTKCEENSCVMSTISKDVKLLW